MENEEADRLALEVLNFPAATEPGPSRSDRRDAIGFYTQRHHPVTCIAAGDPTPPVLTHELPGQ